MEVRRVVFRSNDTGTTRSTLVRNVLQPEPAPGDIPDPYELVAWLNMSDFTFWGREIPKFYGLIGRHRQQKHNFILAIRGTEGAADWPADDMAFLVRSRPLPRAGPVARGLRRRYSTLQVVKRHAAAAG